MSKKAAYALEIPGREDGEEDQTEKQRAFIKRLIDTTEAHGFDDAVLDNLGKWQASYLIERLMEIRDGVDSEKLNKTPIEPGASPGSAMGMKFVVVLIVTIIILYLIL